MKKKSTSLEVVSILVGAILSVTMFISFPVHGAPYYKGKTIEILVESRVGGGTDTIARITANVIPKYIPGKPSIVVRSKPGGAGAIANNVFYKRGKPDGLHVLQNSTSPISMQMRRNPIVKYDLTKLRHIGNIARGGNVLLVRSKVKKNLFDPKAEPVICGTKEGEETWLSMALWGKHFLGWNIRWIPGYSGTSDMALAVERGEIDMIGTTSIFMLKRLMDEGKLEPLTQAGSYKKGKLVRRSDFPNVPTFEEMLGDKKPTGLPWESYMSWIGSSLVGKFLSAPPGTPDKYMSILVNAFAKQRNDPQFDELMKKMVNIEYEVGAGSETAEILNKVLAAPKEAIEYAIDLKKKYGLIATK